jgi:hypothetical protein
MTKYESVRSRSQSLAGNSHPVVIVPPHGATPICAKANGPLVGNKIVGIVQGAYYTRKPGPASEQIQSAAEWTPIIRRCAMHERAAILGALDAALRGSGPPPTTVADALKTWHDAAHTAFLNDLNARQRETRSNLAGGIGNAATLLSIATGSYWDTKTW